MSLAQRPTVSPRKANPASTPAATFARLLVDQFWPIATWPKGALIPQRNAPPKVATGKEPYGPAWGRERWTLEKWAETAGRLPGLGVGICLGPGRGPDSAWLVDIEGDGPQAEESRAKLFGGEVVETMGWSSARGSHQLLIADVTRLAEIMPGLKSLEQKGPTGTGVYKSDALPGLEMRIGGYKDDPARTVKQVQSVCPPTKGNDDKPRSWGGPFKVAAVPATFYTTLAGLIVPKATIEEKPRAPVEADDQADQLWLNAAIGNELGDLESTPEGGRNDRLNVAAYNIGQIVAGGYLNRGQAEAMLLESARRIGLGEGEAAATIRSGLDAGKAKPRQRPERKRPAPSPRPPRVEPDRDPGCDAATGTGPPRANEADNDPHRLARVFLDSRHRHPDHTTLVYHNGEFHQWETAYRPVPIQAVRAVLTSSAKAEFDRINFADIATWEADGSKGKKPTVGRVTTALTNNVVQALGGETLLDDKHVAPCWLGGPGRWPAAEVLPTRNALLHLPSFVDRIAPHRLPPTPRFFCPYATDYDLDERAPAPTNWLEFLSKLWPDDPDSIAGLQEWFGYHLTPDTSQEKIGMLIGPKRSGKGTLAKTLTAMIGEANVCNPKFGALGSQFGTESLIGKMAAIITDARITSRTDISQVVENLLTISGTDRQTIARKHKTDWSGNLPTKFTIISNELPRLADASGALPGRMIIFQLKTSFYDNEDTSLFSAKIRPELPGILLWAIEGWQRLRTRGRLRQPASGQQLVEEMEELSSPVGVFLRERCVIEPGREIMVADLYEAWARWCGEMGNKNPGDQTALGRNLRSVMPHLVTRNCRVGHGYGRKYMGIDLANPASRGPF